MIGRTPLQQIFEAIKSNPYVSTLLNISPSLHFYFSNLTLEKHQTIKRLYNYTGLNWVDFHQPPSMNFTRLHLVKFIVMKRRNVWPLILLIFRSPKFKQWSSPMNFIKKNYQNFFSNFSCWIKLAILPFKDQIFHSLNPEFNFLSTYCSGTNKA